MSSTEASVNESLEQIRRVWPSNAGLLDDLRDRLTCAQPIFLLPFVGAGLSIPMGFPSWGEFLGKLAAECGKGIEIAALIKAGDYEQAAEVVEQGLEVAIFNRRIAHTFGERNSRECALTGPVLALPDLAGGAVVTTNFDRILERVFSESGKPFEHVAWGAQVDSIRRAVLDNKPYLLKLHGDGEERTGRVLTKSEYEKHYTPGDPGSLRAQLGRVFQGRTLLFIGCSLGNDRNMDVLAELLKHASGQEHYAIVEKPVSDDEFFAKQRQLSGRGILPIWYPNSRHELIEPLLRWIAALRPVPAGTVADLVLERPEQRKIEIRSELDLLIPYQQVTAFSGRDEEMRSLQKWVRSEVPISIRVITGAGGSGKTRLAVELLEWLERTESGVWNLGFLTQAEMERFSPTKHENLSQWRRRRPVLAVLDYAAGSADRLRPWIEQLSAAKSGGAKFRLLLLEREASLQTGWLATVFPRGYGEAAALRLFDPPEPIRLVPVSAAADRRAVLRATIEAGAKFCAQVGRAVPAQGENRMFESRLAEPQWGDPLTLMMAGLTALDTDVVEALAIGRRDLALRLAQRECDRVERFGKGAPRGLMAHLAAYVTLCGGLAGEELRTAAKSESEAIGRKHPQDWGVLADCILDALGIGEEARAVQPDIVGEAFLLVVWGSSKAKQGCATVARAAEQHVDRVVASLVHAAQDFCIVESEQPEPLQWLDVLIERAKSDPVLLWRIAGELPEQTVALRERAATVYKLLVSALKTSAESGEGSQSLLSWSLNNLGNRLSELGRREEALQVADEATKIRRQLAAARPDAFLPDLAGSLNNLGNRLSDLGRREEALQAADEATNIYRQLAAARPDAFLPDLAGSLNNLGGMLSELGRREEALQAADEATKIRRQLAAARPDAFLPDLAGSLNNLGNRLSDLGRREEALQASDEATKIRRQLAAARPDAFLPDLAMSLNNLGNRLSALGRREEALQAVDEATNIYRQLAAARPDAFLPYLAGSLNNLGIKLSALGRREEALQAVDEATNIYRQLAAARPDAFLPDLAMSLNNLGGMLSELGRREEALQASDEAANIYRRLVAARPDAFLPYLAGSLNNLGNSLGALGRREEALQAADEATNIRRQLAAARPDAFLADLASSLNNLGGMLSELGRREEALQAADEATNIRRQLAAARPDAFLPYLAGSLNNLGGMLSELGRREEALQAVDEATNIYRQLVAARPDAFLPDLAMSLNNLGNRLSELGRREEALQAVDEATNIYRQLAVAQPDAFLPDLASSLGARGSILMGGDVQGAVESFHEGIVWLTAPFVNSPGQFRSLMVALAQSYLQACEAASLEPDVALLAEVFGKFTDGEAGAAGA